MAEWHETVIPNTMVACATLLFYDHICTLDQEIAHVWRHPIRGGSILFILNRYSPYIDTFMSLNLNILSVNDPKACLKQNTVLTWFIVAGIIISEVILYLRTYALWERTKVIRIILCITAVVVIIPAIVITHFEVKSLQYIPSLTPDKPGCRLGYASPLIFFAYILLVISETVVAVLTGIQARRTLRHSGAPWVRQLYKDGLLYYLFLLVMSLANVLTPIFAPKELSNWLATPQRVLHSILCNRVLLQILRQRSGVLTHRVPAGGIADQNEDSGNPANINFISQLSDSVDTDGNLTFALSSIDTRQQDISTMGTV